MPHRRRPGPLEPSGCKAIIVALLLTPSISVGAAKETAVNALPGRAVVPLRFEPCTLAAPELPITIAAGCATVEVPLDHAHPEGQRIQLAVARVASMNTGSGSGLLAVLATLATASWMRCPSGWA